MFIGHIVHTGQPVLHQISSFSNTITKLKKITIPNIPALRPSLFPPPLPFGCWPGLWLIHHPGWPPDSGRPVGWGVSYYDVWVSSESYPDVRPVLMDTCPSLFWSLPYFSLVLTTFSLFFLAGPDCSMLNCVIMHQDLAKLSQSIWLFHLCSCGERALVMWSTAQMSLGIAHIKNTIRRRPREVYQPEPRPATKRVRRRK